jgi:hypothetical protein
METPNGVDSIDLVGFFYIVFGLGGETETHTKINCPFFRHRQTIPVGRVDLLEIFFEFRDKPIMVTRVAQCRSPKNESDIQLILTVGMSCISDSPIPFCVHTRLTMFPTPSTKNLVPNDSTLF